MTQSRIIPVGEELPPLDEPEEARSSNGRPRCRRQEHTHPKGKTGERFAVLNTFVDFSLAGLSRGEIAVWLVLYRDTRDGTARTAYDDIARRAGLSRRTVGRAIRKLDERGLLKVVHRGGLRRGVSRYRVLGLSKEG
jgi:DNA-binding transcriptional ArsR family regulator